MIERVKCKDCAKYKGNCGNHFIDFAGHINYEIPSEGCTDKYGQYLCFEEGRTMKQRCIKAVAESDISNEYKNKILDILEKQPKF